MKLIDQIKPAARRFLCRIKHLFGNARIDRFHAVVSSVPDRAKERLPVWMHRYIDPVKPYAENPRFVWKLTGSIIVILLTVIAYKLLYDSNRHLYIPQEHQNEAGVIDGPEGGFNPEFVKTLHATMEDVDELIDIPGRLMVNEDSIRAVAARMPGRVERIIVRSGAPVQAGMPILTYYSPEFLSAQKEYLIASKASAIVAATGDKALTGDARDLAEATRSKLGVLGMDDQEIRQLGKTGTPFPTLAVKSPIQGVVGQQNLVAGAYANVGDTLATLYDLNTLWFKGNVYEQELLKIKVGQAVTLKSEAYPGMIFEGIVDFIAPALDPQTHTLTIRATIKNADGILKPDVFVTGTILIGRDRRVVVPAEAVVREGSNAYVVLLLPGNHYKLVNVTVSPNPKGNNVSIVRGLKEGDEIVGEGAVLVYDNIKRKLH